MGFTIIIFSLKVVNQRAYGRMVLEERSKMTQIKFCVQYKRYLSIIAAFLNNFWSHPMWSANELSKIKLC